MTLCKFELEHKAAEATKNICCAKGESALDDGTVNRWLKKVHSSYENPNDQSRLGSPKTIDPEDVLQAIEANPSSSTGRASGELGIS